MRISSRNGTTSGIFVLSIIVSVVALLITYFFAIMDAYTAWFHTPWIITVIISIITACIPGISTIIALISVTTVWHWGWFSAILLVLWPIWLALGVWLIIAIILYSAYKMGINVNFKHKHKFRFK